MALNVPESMEECLYFSNRTMGKGQVLAWVRRKQCPRCKEALMGKPVNSGKVAVRAQEYVCPSCKYQEDKETHERSVMLESQYTCPACGKEGEAAGEYRRKIYQKIPAYVIECQHCQYKMALTKKLKEPKGKKGMVEPSVGDENL